MTTGYATPAQLSVMAGRLLAARDVQLANTPTATIAAAIAAAARLLQAGTRRGDRLLAELPAATGFSRTMVAAGLPHMLAPLAEDALHRLLATALPAPGALDGPARLPAGGRVLALGPRLTVQIQAGNLFGNGLVSLAALLLSKSAVLVKLSRREPVFTPIFVDALREVAPDIAACVACCLWPGDDEPATRMALTHADAVVAYGGNTALADLRRLTPPGVHFTGYGHRLGLGLIDGTVVADPVARTRVARALARDVALFDQQGCVSPHLFCVSAGQAAPLAEALAASLAEVALVLPPGAASASQGAAVHALRGEAEFRAMIQPDVALYASPSSMAYTVLLEPVAQLAPSPLGRTVRIHPVRVLEETLPLLAQISPVLQTCILAAPAAEVTRLAPRLARLGVSRICPPGQAQEPPAHWHHDGMSPMPWLTFCDLEDAKQGDFSEPTPIVPRARQLGKVSAEEEPHDPIA